MNLVDLRDELAPHLERMEKILGRVFPGVRYGVSFLARHPTNPKAHVLLTNEISTDNLQRALADLETLDTKTTHGPEEGHDGH